MSGITKSIAHPGHHKGTALKYDMLYDGRKLHWYGVHLEFNATSGIAGKLPTPEGDVQIDYQHASMQGEQGEIKAGPIPEGWYRMPVAEKGKARLVDEGGNLNRAEGVQSIADELISPHGQHATNFAWGTFRAPLHLIRLDEKAIVKKIGQAWLKKIKKRGSFYIHSSHKGYTHGCIEVQDTFFTKLKEFRSKHPKVTHLVVRVHYDAVNTETYGGTYHE